MEIALDTYRLSADLPSEELYGLSSQIKRSTRSIPANIAEGSSRSSNKDFNRFLEISLGSSFELETDLLLIQELGWIENEKVDSLLGKIEEEQKMLNSFRNKISRL